LLQPLSEYQLYLRREIKAAISAVVFSPEVAAGQLSRQQIGQFRLSLSAGQPD
jgi:hypothetical protein